MTEWNRQLRAVLAQPDLIGKLSQLGLDVETMTREEAAALVVSHLKAWKVRIEAAGMKPTD